MHAAEEARSTVVHPTALVAPGARLGQGVVIGPWCSVGPDVTIEDGVELISHVVVDGHTRLGAGSRYFPFCTVGMAPQDLKYKGEPTRCEIGAGTVVREHVTIHRGTATGSGLTKVGQNVLIMANAHVAHDCVLGDRVIIVNNVVMGGHVSIEDDARIMGSAAIHQFVRIGHAALVGGVAGVEADVIPYGSVLGNRARLIGLHWIWLRRNGVQSDEIHRMRKAFLTLYPKNGCGEDPFSVRLERVRAEFGDNPRVREILDFIDAPSRRGLVRPARQDLERAETEGA
ncbi:MULTISPECIES: acyl-ACP--UDP-N-acetylglucosamine O-acyltransferase [Acetobacter]|uniref:Acyl-ACP--UDP-N-acetylglucosamine O-acyltransferase n=2 Tax=Acetobacter TaxID=434 RepID=A0AAN1PJZ2_9PROT|nr:MULTISPECIES: acyl-ACP--UDP-N-acetylglucosamine O-acyltransferase [Acetobacter]ANA14908.1 UDP-N-acetylglucosamine acyltransferase [Acetobacter oryzifermentans]ASL41618.1 acyl-[acyl-carrier-protein]--UDP-N-acetylglucosamine O-acyltransferase [Acetobacter oryzifermentans]AXN01736.1 acyl-ACP--UDP-N-acetylglucosamine O-acyltransferase [Acetobacter pomorum]KAA8395883.1 acyl-ACP--UDP-N-acetylglucosamine O-acyltransferase [Acetobacter sp. DmW_125124]KAA8398560.1 acyl-ACP--UDP-N-acetylglucosamine O